MEKQMRPYVEAVAEVILCHNTDVLTLSKDVDPDAGEWD